MAKIIPVIALLIFSQTLVSCLPDTSRKTTTAATGQRPLFIRDVVTHPNFSKDVRRNTVPSEVKGSRGIGFVRPEDRDIPPFERPQTEEFRLTVAERFTPLLILVNNRARPSLFLVTVVLDYRQVPFALDGQTGLLHEVTVPPSTELELPFRLAIGSQGIHDLQVMAFDDPYNQTLDFNYRSDLYGSVTARRATLVVGDTRQPGRTLEVLDVGRPVPSEVTFKAQVGFAKPAASNALYPSQRQLYVDTAHPNQAYPFQVVVTNVEKQAATYALIPFFDFHQVPLAGKDVLALYLKPDEEAIIDATAPLPKERGVHQLQLIWLFDPYASVLRKEVLAPFVLGSPRVAIAVK